MDTSGVIQLIVLIVLLVLSAFFSSAETAFTTVNKVRLRTLAEDGNKRAVRVEHILSDYSKMLSTILVGNNIVNIAATSIATALTIRIWGSVFVGVSSGILTFVVLILGEVVPKSWAKINSDKLSLAYSGTIRFFMVMLTPIVFIVDKLSRGVLRLVRIDPDAQDDQITEDELKTYVDVSHEGGEIESEEHEMIYNVLNFSDSEAEDIMIPREDMSTVGVDATYDEVMEVFRDKMFTRIPVWEEEPDNFIGLVNIKDFILVEDKSSFATRDIIREGMYTVEHKKTLDLLKEMKEKTLSLAFVLNEYGSCVGMITMEDLLEEIVGDIRDEFDEDEEELIIELGSRSYLIEASMKTDDINDALETELASDDYDSIGGLMIEALERLPEDGEVVELEDGTLLQAKGIHQNRILKVLMTLPEPPAEGEDDREDTDSDDRHAEKDKSRSEEAIVTTGQTADDDDPDDRPAVEIGADVEM
ncbi:MAG: HlyC/CorC family transporter [Lachnospiraceae bacterium]|nr:HlyC/CorC family transporter [Lachnospiraceae bacterium]